MSDDKLNFRRALGSFGEKMSQVKESVDRTFESIAIPGRNRNIQTTDNNKLSHKVYISKKDQLAKILSDAENILLFRSNDFFTVSLKQCFNEWRLYERSLDMFYKLNFIKKVYYGEGKIYDLANEIKKIVDSPDEMKNADYAKAIIYTNYLFFIKCNIDDLKNDYENKGQKLNYSSVADIKTVEAFIQSECYRIQPVVSLYEAYKLGRELEKMSEKDFDYEKFLQLTTLTEEYRYGSRNTEETDKLSDNFRNKRASIESEIEKTEILYKKLTEVFTEELFNELDYQNEESSVNKVSDDELRDFYISHLTKVYELTEEYKKDTEG